MRATEFDQINPVARNGAAARADRRGAGGPGDFHQESVIADADDRTLYAGAVQQTEFETLAPAERAKLVPFEFQDIGLCRCDELK